jgi:peptidoglycan/xylan/chitin deacetylase (PgdA/CDA1 family)
LDEKQEKCKIDYNSKDNSMLNWKQVLEMGNSMEIGSHTCNHNNLLELTGEEKINEIEESKSVIKARTVRQVKTFSYPSRNKDSDLEEKIKRSGYLFAVTGRAGINDLANPSDLKRINIWEGTSLSKSGSFSKGFFSYKLLGF